MVTTLRHITNKTVGLHQHLLNRGSRVHAGYGDANNTPVDSCLNQLLLRTCVWLQCHP
jgi:hypothetical protein